MQFKSYPELREGSVNLRPLLSSKLLSFLKPSDTAVLRDEMLRERPEWGSPRDWKGRSSLGSRTSSDDSGEVEEHVLNLWAASE